MELTTDTVRDFIPAERGESSTLAGEALSAMADFKSIFGAASEQSAAAIKEQFGDLLLVDDGALASNPVIGRSANKPAGEQASNREAPQSRLIANDTPTAQRSGEVQTDLDEDGQVRRGIVVDQDGLRVRELEIPKGNTPLDEAPERRQAPQDRFVEIDNERRPVEVFQFDNLASESDEDGEIKRVIAVDEDGLRSRELTVD